MEALEPAIDTFPIIYMDLNEFVHAGGGFRLARSATTERIAQVSSLQFARARHGCSHLTCCRNAGAKHSHSRHDQHCSIVTRSLSARGPAPKSVPASTLCRPSGSCCFALSDTDGPEPYSGWTPDHV